MSMMTKAFQVWLAMVGELVSLRMNEVMVVALVVEYWCGL